MEKHGEQTGCLTPLLVLLAIVALLLILAQPDSAVEQVFLSMQP